MTTLKRLTCNDFFTFNSVNLDIFTETVSYELCVNMFIVQYTYVSV